MLDVMLDVLAVLDVLDDCQEDLGVAGPEKNLVDGGWINGVSGSVKLLAIEGQEHHGPAGPKRLDPATERVDPHVGETGHRQDEIEALTLELLKSGLCRGYVGHSRRSGEADVAILEEDLLGKLSVLLQGKGVVG